VLASPRNPNNVIDLTLCRIRHPATPVTPSDQAGSHLPVKISDQLWIADLRSGNSPIQL